MIEAITVPVLLLVNSEHNVKPRNDSISTQFLSIAAIDGECPFILYLSELEENKSYLPMTPNCCGVKEQFASWEGVFRGSVLPASDVEEIPDRTEPCLLIDLMLGLLALEDESRIIFIT